MRAVLLLSVAITTFALQDRVTAETDAELVRRIRSTLDGVEMGDREVAAEFAAATPQQQKRLLAALSQIIEEEFKAPRRLKDQGVIGTIGACAQALEYIGDEPTIMAAFGSRLTQIEALFSYAAEVSAVVAVSRCRDRMAVDALADLARLRQKQLIELLPQLPPAGSRTDEQNEAYWITKQSWLYALEAMAGNPNPEGKPLARELRDEFTKLAPTLPYSDALLQDLAAKVDPYLGDTIKRVRPRSGTPVGDRAEKSKQLQPSKAEQPATVTTSEPKPPSSGGMMWVAGVLATLVLLAALIWFLRKK